MPISRFLWRRLYGFRGLAFWGGSSLTLWLLLTWPAQAALELRVAVKNGSDILAVGSSTQAIVRDSSGASIGQMPGGRSISVEFEGNALRLANWRSSTFWLEPEAGGYVFIGDRWYRGRVYLVPYQGGITAINLVELEAYLYSVLGSEMASDWPLEALRAQAVAARSYAIYHSQRAFGQLYDVDSSTAHQVYRGLEAEALATRAAVESTRYQVLTYGGQVIEAVFHSSSGGYTENVEDVWQRPIPYLRSVQDYDQGAPVYQWSQVFSQAEFQQRLGGIGNLVAAIPERVTPHGRVITMRLEGSYGDRRLSGNEIRKALELRSTLFTIAIANDQIQITGRGYGHGIGLSQWGAHNLAVRGHTYQQILNHYYRGATLSQLQAQ